jgi:hypothetical protein
MTKKTGKKDFMSGLDRLIQNTTETPPQPSPQGREEEASQQPTIEARDETTTQPTHEVREPEKRKKEAVVEKEKQITITIPPGLKRSIKKYCAVNDITIKELFIRSVGRYMKEGE